MIAGLAPGWVEFTVAEQNLGGHITAREVLDIMWRVDVLATVETSDQQNIIDALIRSGYGVERWTHELGQAATAIAYNRGVLEVLETRCYPLYPGGDIGPGTGPDHGKPKWLLVVKFRHLETGRVVIVAVLHCYAGQAEDKREEIATAMVATAALRLARRLGVAVLLGDFNTLPKSPVTAPLRLDGWKCNHLELGRLVTHSTNWSPDHAWVRDLLRLAWWARVAFIRHRTVKNGSDHRGLIVTLRLRMTLRMRRRARRQGRLTDV